MGKPAGIERQPLSRIAELAKGTTVASIDCVEIPGDVVRAARMTGDELKRELAVHLFQQGKLSLGKARELAGMTRWAFQQLLGSRGIPVHYDVEDYERDLANLKELGRL